MPRARYTPKTSAPGRCLFVALFLLGVSLSAAVGVSPGSASPGTSTRQPETPRPAISPRPLVSPSEAIGQFRAVWATTTRYRIIAGRLVAGLAEPERRASRAERLILATTCVREGELSAAATEEVHVRVLAVIADAG